MTDLTSVPRWTESGMSSTPMCTITEVSKSAGSALKWALKCKMHTLLASYIMVSRQVLVVAAKINLLLTWAEKIQKRHLHFCLSCIYSVISSCVHFSKEQATLKELNEPCHLLPLHLSCTLWLLIIHWHTHRVIQTVCVLRAVSIIYQTLINVKTLLQQNKITLFIKIHLKLILLIRGWCVFTLQSNEVTYVWNDNFEI